MMKGFQVSTIFPNNERITEEKEILFIIDPGNEKQVVNLHPEVEYQTFEGFGGAFTDSAGYVYSQMDKEDRKALLSSYFSSEHMNYRLGRMHIDSCDFSLEQYEAMSDENDTELVSFSLERTEKYIIPMVMDAQEELGRPIEMMITPWSPPAFMKTNGERSHGGKVKKGYEAFWAEYICKYIIELRKSGINICRMSIQNEPKAVQIWDSCIFTAEEERDFLKNYLYPALVKNKLTDIEIFIWDHNKERLYERARTIITEETDHMVTGLAFHWYSGDHFEELEMVKRCFPDKKLILSEACIEYSIYDSMDYLANAQKYGHDIIGNFNSGMNAFYDWNLLLDETGGPNHVKNLCDAPYLYDTKNKKLMERNTLAYIWHFSHFLRPGAVRVGFSKYTDQLDMTAFRNPDGTILCIIMNPHEDEKTMYLRMHGMTAELHVQAQSVNTIVVKESGL